MSVVANRFIHKLARLAPLDDAAVQSLTTAMVETHKLNARKDFIREGDRPGSLLIILDGWACRYKVLPTGARQILAFLIAGDSCDLQSEASAEMDHGIQTISQCVIAKIDGQVIDALVTEHPMVMKAMYRSQLVDEATQRALIVSIGRRSSIERVAHLLCELYLRSLGIGHDGIEEFTLPVSQIILADALGMTPVHINRVLKQLRVADAITIARGSLVIVNPIILAEIAGFDENYINRRSQHQT